MKKIIFLVGSYMSRFEFFRNGRLGHVWSVKYHPEVVTTDDYLLWQHFLIK